MRESTLGLTGWSFSYKFAIHGKTLQSIFFHNAASVLSKKQKNVPDFFLCSWKEYILKTFA